MPVPLSAKTPTEEKIIGFDFTSQMAPRDSILSVLSVTKAEPSGTDPGAAALTLATAVIYPDAPIVLVLVIGGLDTLMYDLICAVRTARGERSEVWLQLPIAVKAI